MTGTPNDLTCAAAYVTGENTITFNDGVNDFLFTVKFATGTPKLSTFKGVYMSRQAPTLDKYSLY